MVVITEDRPDRKSIAETDADGFFSVRITIEPKPAA